MKKIIIHMGQYKTGSTSIQKLMWGVRDEMQKYGILYPELFVRDGAHFLISDLLKKEIANGGDSIDLVALRNEIEQSKAETVVISCESLSGATVRRFAPEMMVYMWKRLAYLFDGFDVRVIFYFRRQDESIDSRIIQEIKGQSRKSTINYEPFLYEKSSLNYHYFYGLLEQVFGKGSVDVRLYDRKFMFKSDIRYDFLNYLGVPFGKVSVPVLEHNVTPSARMIGFYRVLNSLKMTDGDYQTIISGLWKELCSQNEPKAVVLSTEQRKKVMDYFYKCNVKFVSEYVPECMRDTVSDSIFAPVSDVAINAFIDGYDVMRILRRKGFVVARDFEPVSGVFMS